LRILAQAGDLSAELPPKFRKFGSLLGRALHAMSEDRRGAALLYQGCPAVMQTLAFSNFLYFFIHAWAKKRFGIKSQVLQTMAASSFAATISVVITEPLWRANTVLRTMPRDAAARNTLFSVFAKLVREEGAFALWNGVPVSIWLVSNPIIQFTLYELLKRRLLGRRSSSDNLTAGRAFIIGAISKAIAAVTTSVRRLSPPAKL
jgi:adenine nucleotide transporter 17